MNDNPPNLTDVNSIAYNANLRDQLKRLHDMLGVEVTDMASGAMDYGVKFAADGDALLKYMSNLASELSIALISIRKKLTVLSYEEQQDYEKIKSLTAVIGNLQDKLNRVLKLVKSANDLNQQIHTQGVELADQIMEAQDEFSKVRASINAYGFLSDNPELAQLFNQQNQVNQPTINQI